MFSGNVQFQLMELECAKLETRLSQIHVTPQHKKRKSRKTRWDLDGLENETRYLDNMARKALSPLSLYPSQKPFEYEEDFSHYPKIREPHRIGEKVRIVEVSRRKQNNTKQSVERTHEFSMAQSASFANKTQGSGKSIVRKQEIDFGNQNSMERKHKRQHSSIKINRIVANPTPPRKKKSRLILGAPPKGGLDNELDEFVDHISDFGKWND